MRRSSSTFILSMAFFSNYIASFYKNTRTPPYCCAALLDPRGRAVGKIKIIIPDFRVGNFFLSTPFVLPAIFQMLSSWILNILFLSLPDLNLDREWDFFRFGLNSPCFTVLFYRWNLRVLCSIKNTLYSYGANLKIIWLWNYCIYFRN